MLDGHLNDPPAQVQATLPLLQQYLQSPNIEMRRNTLLTIFVLARRPNSSSELASLLPALYPHLEEQDLYLRQGTLVAMATLKPTPPPQAITSIANALEKANTTDGFGTMLAANLARLEPNSVESQDAILSYLHKQQLTDSARADVIEAIANPKLGDRIVVDIVQVATTTPPGRLRNASIDACADIGPRAASQIKGLLDTIQASNSETTEAHAVASKALAVLNQQ
jgi:hypothetical protein